MKRRPLIWRVTPDELARMPYHTAPIVRVQRGAVRLVQIGFWVALFYGIYLATSYALHGIALGTIR